MRKLFLDTVLKICGVEKVKDLPPAVRNVLNEGDFGNAGHPLTVRRITAVKAAIEAQFNAEAENVLWNIRSVMRRDFINEMDANDTKRLMDECHSLTKTMVDATKGDMDLLHALAADNCALAQKILLENVEVEEVDPAARELTVIGADDIKKRTVKQLRSQQQILFDMGQYRDAVNSLRKAANGAKISYAHIYEFANQPIPDDKLAEMAQAVRDLDLEPVKDDLSANDHDSKFRAMCLIQKMVNSVVEKAGLQVDEEGVANQEKLRSCYFFVYDLICGRLSKENLESLRVAMDRNVQFKTEVTALDAIAKGEWEENDVDEPVKTKVRKFAQGFSYCAQNVMQIAVWDALETYRSSLISSGSPLKAGKIRPVYDQLKNTVQAVDI